jgi:hypothetical protein
VREIHDYSNKGPGPLQRRENHKKVKMGWDDLKIFRTTGSIFTRLGTNHPWRERIQVCSKEGNYASPWEDNSEKVNIH